MQLVLATGTLDGWDVWGEQAWFRAKRGELQIGQSTLARLMLAPEDDRRITPLLHSLNRMASGNVRTSGEMRALPGVLAKTASERVTEPAAK